MGNMKEPPFGSTIVMEIPISCGFPSPAQDSKQSPLDFNKLLIHHPSSTFCLKAKDSSLTIFDINKGDLFIVDASLVPQKNDLIVVDFEGVITVKKLIKHNGTLFIEDTEGKVPMKESIHIKGVICSIVRNIR